MTEKFVIWGKKSLSGTLEVQGSKNATFSLLAASLLTEEPCIFSNVPRIEDVFLMLNILSEAGVEVDWVDSHTVRVCAQAFDPAKVNRTLVSKFRGSILLLAPLCTKTKNFSFVHPGGCLIGARPVDTHLDVFSQFGVKVTTVGKEGGDEYVFEAPPSFESRDIVLSELSVTATENALLLAASLPVKTRIFVADSDYQVQELACVLQKMGARIDGVGTHTLVVEGAHHLNGVHHTVLFDPIEAGTFILLAAAAKSNLTIQNVEVKHLTLFLKRLKDFGLLFNIQRGNSVEVLPWIDLHIDKIQALPHPGLPTDLESSFGVLATQTAGPTLLHDPLFEGRLQYLKELDRMGADIVFCDPHRAIVNGPTPLHGAEIVSTDLRGGAALIIAGLIAEGKTTLANIYQIDRGYERLEERLQKIGADIKRVST